jgi:hypothetical protein
MVLSERNFLGAEVRAMSINFENEGEKFREYMASHPNAVVVLRKADGSCEVEDQPDTIVGEFTVVEQPPE